MQALSQSAPLFCLGSMQPAHPIRVRKADLDVNLSIRNRPIQRAAKKKRRQEDRPLPPPVSTTTVVALCL
jgi:hypothetical protein